MLRSASLLLWLSFALGALACGGTHDAPSGGAQSGAGAGGSSPSAGGGTAGDASKPTTGAGGGDRQDSAGSGGAVPAAGGAANGLGGTTATAGAPTGAAGSGEGGAAGNGATRVSLLVFSRTAAYRHDSIPAGVQALTKLAMSRSWQLAATEDPSRFSDAGLAPYNVVIFLSTTGDVLDDTQQAAFERFIRSGKGFIGIHSATDTEYDWAWYGALVGAYFREHPAVQAANVLVEDATNPATAGLPNPWHRTDEWYAFKSNPRPNVHVLLSLDESSYTPGSANMNGDHPIAWCHEYDGGRAFYTALGHTSESFSDPLFMGQLEGAVGWVLAR
ncbi:MAG TPA: ThuA domain-containing protein [Polyangiaceae bacterium]